MRLGVCFKRGIEGISVRQLEDLQMVAYGRAGKDNHTVFIGLSRQVAEKE